MPAPSIWSQFGNAASNAVNKFFGGASANPTTNTINQQPSFNPSFSQNYGAQPAAPQFYQIRPNDTFDSIGSQFGVPASELQNTNGVVPPPKGSFIEIPQLAQQQTNYYQQPGVSAPTGYGPYWQQQRAAQGQMPGNAFQASGPNSFTNSQGGVNTAELVANIQNSPTTPQSIPGAVLNQLTIAGQPATPQLMAQNGYTYNQATGSWVLSGAGGVTTPGGGTTPQTNNNWMTNPALRQVTFNRGGRHEFQTTLKWAQNAWRRKRRGPAAPPPQQAGGPAATNAGGTAQTVLDLTLGSG